MGAPVLAVFALALPTQQVVADGYWSGQQRFVAAGLFNLRSQVLQDPLETLCVPLDSDQLW